MFVHYCSVGICGHQKLNEHTPFLFMDPNNSHVSSNVGDIPGSARCRKNEMGETTGKERNQTE